MVVKATIMKMRNTEVPTTLSAWRRSRGAFHTLLFAAAAVLLGAQAISVWVFAKVFTISEGLLPPHARFERLRAGRGLEAGLVIGAILLILGVVLAAAAVGVWGERHFGSLAPSRTPRLVIPSVTCMTLGANHLMLASFFVGVLALSRK